MRRRGTFPRNQSKNAAAVPHRRAVSDAARGITSHPIGSAQRERKVVLFRGRKGHFRNVCTRERAQMQERVHEVECNDDVSSCSSAEQVLTAARSARKGIHREVLVANVGLTVLFDSLSRVSFLSEQNFHRHF